LAVKSHTGQERNLKRVYNIKDLLAGGPDAEASKLN